MSLLSELPLNLQGTPLGSLVLPIPSSTSCPALPEESLVRDGGTCGEEKSRKGEEDRVAISVQQRRETQLLARALGLSTAWFLRQGSGPSLFLSYSKAVPVRSPTGECKSQSHRSLVSLDKHFLLSELLWTHLENGAVLSREGENPQQRCAVASAEGSIVNH